MCLHAPAAGVPATGSLFCRSASTQFLATSSIKAAKLPSYIQTHTKQSKLCPSCSDSITTLQLVTSFSDLLVTLAWQ